MESQLSLTAIQTELFWEEKQKNFQQLAKQIERLPATDIIILPEMFTTGLPWQGRNLLKTCRGRR